MSIADKTRLTDSHRTTDVASLEWDSASPLIDIHSLRRAGDRLYRSGTRQWNAYLAAKLRGQQPSVEADQRVQTG